MQVGVAPRVGGDAQRRSPRTEGVELADELLNILEQRLHLAAQMAHEPALDDREQA